jgi:hypothetical protein
MRSYALVKDRRSPRHRDTPRRRRHQIRPVFKRTIQENFWPSDASTLKGHYEVRIGTNPEIRDPQSGGLPIEFMRTARMESLDRKQVFISCNMVEALTATAGSRHGVRSALSLGQTQCVRVVAISSNTLARTAAHASAHSPEGNPKGGSDCDITRMSSFQTTLTLSQNFTELTERHSTVAYSSPSSGGITLFNAACPTQPDLLYMCFDVPRIILRYAFPPLNNMRETSSATSGSPLTCSDPPWRGRPSAACLA